MRKNTMRIVVYLMLFAMLASTLIAFLEPFFIR
ncbi:MULTISPECIES: stressosome-associated protein Prli42 [Paenibacillus]|nr:MULTISPECIES: stressosome-associated protein Prli42 [Paenibacillus]MDU0329391.1 stressosome-associated protein Prli42 [Paenibacillus sp. 3LSP]MEC2342682.1 stressosome-associated protein Prli42 [Paenibacillus barengoltzii]